MFDLIYKWRRRRREYKRHDLSFLEADNNTALGATSIIMCRQFFQRYQVTRYTRARAKVTILM
jgi:hypothetical protein